MTNVPISDLHILYSQQFDTPLRLSDTCPQRDHLFGFCGLHGEAVVPIVGIPERMILSDALKGGDSAHEKADFRGLVHGICKTEHLRIACRY